LFQTVLLWVNGLISIISSPLFFSRNVTVLNARLTLYFSWLVDDGFSSNIKIPYINRIIFKIILLPCNLLRWLHERIAIQNLNWGLNFPAGKTRYVTFKYYWVTIVFTVCVGFCLYNDISSYVPLFGTIFTSPTPVLISRQNTSNRSYALLDRLISNEQNLNTNNFGVIGPSRGRFTNHGLVDISEYTNQLTTLSYTSINRGEVISLPEISREVVNMVKKFNNTNSQFCEITTSSSLKFMNIHELFIEIGSKVEMLSPEILLSFTIVSDMYLFSMIALLFYLNNTSSGLSYAISNLNTMRLAFKGDSSQFLSQYVVSNEFIELCNLVRSSNSELFKTYFSQLEFLLTYSELSYLTSMIF